MRRWIFTIIALAILVLYLFGSGLVNFFCDLMWFNELGYESVMLKIIWTQLAVGAFVFLAFFLIIYLNAWLARRNKEETVLVYEDKIIEIPSAGIADKALNYLLTLGIAIFSLMVTGGSVSRWEEFLFFLNPSQFGAADPVFSLDIGFYVFRLPVIHLLLSLTILATLSALVLTGLIYFYQQNVQATRKGLNSTSAAKIHLGILLGALFIEFSFGIGLSAFNLLYSRDGVVFGAGYADIHATLPAIIINAILALGVGAVTILSLNQKKWTRPLAAFGIWIAFYFVGAGIYPALIQNLQVAPNEIAKEAPYIKRNIEYTRLAYGLHRIEEKEFPVEETLTAQDLLKNSSTVDNIRLWDYSPALATLRQLQEIRTYYEFNDVDIDRYDINGSYRQVLISAREISYRDIPSKIWINEHFTYTHGYGAVMIPASRASSDGLPRFFIKDIPPESSISLRISRPEIYYGEIANDYCFVKTGAREFDYPAGDKNVYSSYSGEGGVSAGSLWRKFLFAARFSSIKILFSNEIGPESRIMYYRRIRERAAKIAPFLKYDSDPYIVIGDNGKLYWIMDGYTTTGAFPYSTPHNESDNYIRNSVKAVIDAYDGKIDFYISDPEDPLIKTYAKIFPGLFKEMKDMPGFIKKHLRYPLDLFSIQARMYAVYHMSDPQVFYNKEDLWEVAKRASDGEDSRMEPYYLTMKLPGEKKEEFILFIPFTPSQKSNMSAWLAARCDDPRYGSMMAYRFPKKKLIYGPAQVAARINQEPEISKQLSLWSQRGSQVIHGSIMVIPIERSLLYVEPLYLRAEKGQMPELKRVIVAYGDRVVMEETLENSLKSIFGGKGYVKIDNEEVKGKPDGPVRQEGLIDLANQHFERAQEFQKQGNWEKYGEEIEKLSGTLKELKGQKGR